MSNYYRDHSLQQWLLWFGRKQELWRGQMIRWRGARVGKRFGIGRSVVILYPTCLCAGDDVTITDSSFLHCLSSQGITIGSQSSFGRNLWLSCGQTPHNNGSFSFGSHSYIGPNAVIGAGGPISIGDHVQIGPHFSITAENHTFADPHKRIDEQPLNHQGIIIEDNCWVGGHVTVLDGVTIGEGCVIGAGAVVTRSLPPYSIAMGVPARVVRSRLP